MQADTLRRLTARPAESDHLLAAINQTHYLVDSNEVAKIAFSFN
jgi:hypothetical protein